jgi:3-deoxy-D-manno-octulosonate 8-phosphate phosphatase (KDO 8-P phosphatase)
MPLESDAKMIERLRAVDWLVLDVDGVLTDGSIVYDESGNELKKFHVRDGSGLKIWNHVGKKAAIITGRNSRLVHRRGLELGIAPVIQGALEKVPALRQLVRETGVPAERMCAIGDDIPDLGVMMSCGLAVAVADASPEVRQASHFVTCAPGGRGAVRETIELILQAQGRWSPIVDRFLGERL